MSYSPKYSHKKQQYYLDLILTLIPHEPCKMSSTDLAYNTGLNSRDIRYIIQKLRDDGHPICATPENGYWIARYSSDLDGTISKLQSHIENTQTTLDALLEARKNLKKSEEAGYDYR